MVNLKELHSNDSLPVSYTKDKEGSLVRISAPARHGQGALGLIRHVLLPEGYPDSVSGDYLEYQIWDTVQAFASSISGSLATAAVLQGVGVGDSEATPLAATLTWILKDGAGMVGRIVFAAYSGTSLDYDCKRWRMFADILNDGVMMVELLAGALPKQMVMPTLCVAGVGRSLVGVAGGATKAAVAQHQARRQNMADLAAKDGSQETVVNLMALCVNLALLPIVSGTPNLPFLLFLVLACLHIYSNYRAVSCLVMSTLNMARLNILLDKYKETKLVGSVLETNRAETVLRSAGSGKVRIELGVSLQSLEREEVDSLEQVLRREDPYLLIRREKFVKLLITNLATPRDVYRGYIEGYLGDGCDANVIVTALEDMGWDLGTLALSTQGFVLQVEK
eukprot:GFUD01012813.1.p1 GENE.GFUD01012813.1~~GFUD01012813.1.p1  ORF type:complete len:393 (+),score=127.08 GFUD01012813.1:524-1702(+)